MSATRLPKTFVERGRALSSLTTDDAIAYRAFVRRPTPRERWVGPPRPRDSVEWRPFSGGLSARSAAYALTVLSALFRWLIEQRYVLANRFAGVKVRGHASRPALDTARGFTEGEWLLLRAIADGLEWSYGWSEPAAQRLRFLLDFGYATGLRASELVGAVLGNVRLDGHDEHWLHVVGKGGKPGKVSVPPLAYMALDQYLTQRGLPVSRDRWNPKTPLVGSLGEDGTIGITGDQLWRVLRRFFMQAADTIESDHPVAAEKLRRATPIGCGTATPAMRWHAGPSSLPCATTCAMRRLPRRQCACTAMNLSAPGRCGRLSALENRQLICKDFWVSASSSCAVRCIVWRGRRRVAERPFCVNGAS